MAKNTAGIYHWLLAIRPKTLPAAVAPVAVGVALAIRADVAALYPALAALTGALLLQIAVNLANDYFDAKNRIDSAERIGPVRVTQSGLIPANQVKMAMIFCLLAAGLIFLYLTMVAGAFIFWLGVASLLAALAYSGGPYPLASHGLGELFVFIFFGLVAVCGTYYVQAGSLDWLVVVASWPPGLLISAIMVVNNLRDIDTDGKAGKHTLAVRLGSQRTRILYLFFLFGAYLVLPLLYFLYLYDLFVFLPVLTVPVAGKLVMDVFRLRGSELNQLLAATARLSLAFSLLLAIGLIV